MYFCVCMHVFACLYACICAHSCVCYSHTRDMAYMWRGERTISVVRSHFVRQDLQSLTSISQKEHSNYRCVALYLAFYGAWVFELWLPMLVQQVLLRTDPSLQLLIFMFLMRLFSRPHGHFS